MRAVQLSPVLKNILSAYLASRSDDKAALFIRYGRKAHVGAKVQVSPRTVERLVQRHAVAAGLTQQVTPQIIRHSFAVRLFHSGIAVDIAQSLLGYAHESSVVAYQRHTKQPRQLPEATI